MAWLTYAGFLQSRIAYGWQRATIGLFCGRCVSVRHFTYLGVSYLYPASTIRLKSLSLAITVERGFFHIPCCHRSVWFIMG